MRLNSRIIAAALALASAAALPSPTYAQAPAATQTEAAETFKPHWFLQPQAGASYTVGETSFGDLVSPAAAISAGYRFTPSFGLRAGLSGWQARGSWVNPRSDYKFDYLQLNADAMLSFTNLFCGSNPARVLDFYGFAGLGVAAGFDNDEAAALAAAGRGFEKLWSGKKLFPAGRASLGLNINVSRTVAINIEVNANALPDNFNSKKGSKADWQFNALAGISYSFGGRSRALPAAEEPIAAPEPAPAPTPEPEPEPAPAPAPAPVRETPAPMVQDIFFAINSAAIDSENRPKVDALIEYMRANPEAKAVVTGYADKATGTAAYNMKISERRAEAVASALRDAGISASRITSDAKGDTVQPFAEIVKNRVTIAVTQF
ncbi:MAG: OmpA family protein [Duncaniella sp.]|nr:OmpA family protein [Duncaniella sp.]